MTRQDLSSYAYSFIYLLIIVAHFAILFDGVKKHFPNVDEVAHLPAGESHLEFGRFDLYRVNPPLVRTIAAIPISGTELEIPWKWYSSQVGIRPEFMCGRGLLKEKKIGLATYYVRARVICFVFTAVLLISVMLWLRPLLSNFGSTIALAYFAFDPNILAHGQTIVPDAAAVSFGFLAAYWFWLYSTRASRFDSVMAGISLGVALLTKITWISGLVTFPFVTLILLMASRGARNAGRLRDTG